MAKSGKTAGGSHAKKSLSDTTLLLVITIVVFFAMYIGAMVFQGKGFLKPQTFFNILNANAALIIAACGMTLVMITGGIDISVGGVAALVSMCCAVYLDYHNGNPAVACLIAIAIGLGFGLVQGFLVAYLDIQPFIVSLAGMFFARGMTTIVHTNPFNVENEAFVALKDTGMMSSVPSYQFITAVRGWPCNRRRQNTKPCDTLHRPLHGFIIQHLKGMIFKRMKLRQRYLPYLFQPILSAALLCGEDISVSVQADVSAFFLHRLTPPSSIRGKPPLPFPSDRVEKYFSPRH